MGAYPLKELSIRENFYLRQEMMGKADREIKQLTCAPLDDTGAGACQPPTRKPACESLAIRDQLSQVRVLRAPNAPPWFACSELVSSRVPAIYGNSQTAADKARQAVQLNG